VADNPTTGACLPGCFVADTGACQNKPAQCQKRTGAEWTHGTCIGQASVCDPLSQGDCGAQQTCVVVAGSAIIGTAYVCVGAAGNGASGEACADSNACTAGLWCYEGECAALCVPGGQPCQSGVCQDIGSMLYLDTGTLGVCQ
jgi:hypothetical protein